KVKKELARQLSYLVGGPHKPDPEEKPPYKGLGITGEEFDAAMKHFQKALEKSPVEAKWANFVLVRVADKRSEVSEKKPEPAKGTLWERLGGDKGAAAVATDYYARATAKDSKANLDRGGTLKLSDPAVADTVKEQLNAQVIIAADGPGADKLKPFA